MTSTFRDTLTFDDVLLEPSESAIFPTNTDLKTRLTRLTTLDIPLMSAAMDTVTESKLAISLAQAGGIGTIHRNMSIDYQTKEVKRVKRFESGRVSKPITIHADASLHDALSLMSSYQISSIPVIEPPKDGSRYGLLIGILTNRDVRFVSDRSQPVRERMVSEDLITVPEEISIDEAKARLSKYRIEQLLVTDDAGRCIGMITAKDIEKSEHYPHACKDDKGCLRVAAAVGTGDEELRRAIALIDSGVDILVVDTAHGHSQRVIETIKRIRSLPTRKVEIIAGNIATAQGARTLIDAGADAIKVGIGPGSICTTRIVAGIGVPQLTALMDVKEVCQAEDIPMIADGGIKHAGDLAKAIAIGADCVMLGVLFAGTDEAPGDVILYEGRSYKSYRGMGSIGAMTRGSADRYFQEEFSSQSLIPEGIEGRVPYKGPLHTVIYQLLGGLRAAMSYTGNATISSFQRNARFIRISPASLRESHVHDVQITNESPNYRHPFLTRY